MALNDETEMVFAEDVEVDPVSGNEVPPGSMPEEVRDDIDAVSYTHLTLPTKA